jgi:uncharacterized protein DUF4837
MKKSRSILFTVMGLFMLSFWACDNQKSNMPHSVGKSSEILVVTDNKGQWKSAIGDTLMNFFYQNIEGMSQPEPLFNLYSIPLEAFNVVYENNRNILIIDIKPEAEKPYIETKKNVWASPQQVIKLVAPNQDAMIDLFGKNQNAILEMFLEMEFERINQAFTTTAEAKVLNTMKERFGFVMNVPSIFEIAKETKNFMWLRRETLTYSQGIMIYRYNYTDTVAFDPDFIQSKRDFITKTYIPGPADSSYMKLERKFVPPVFKSVNFKDNYAIETRGLWEVENDFMGGPFVSYTFIDQSNQMVVTIDAYVYAPNEPKRDLMRQLLAILNSFKFTGVK